jgi:hypothetical protein
VRFPDLPDAAWPPRAASGARLTVLEPEVSPRSAALTALVFTLPAAYLAYRAVRADLALGFPAFSLLFVPLALLLLLVLLDAVLAVGGMPIEVAIEEEAVRLGGSPEVAWRLARGQRRIRRLELGLEAQEHVELSDGDSHRAERQIFIQGAVERVTDPARIAAGSGRLRIPADLMHTFQAREKSVTWLLQVQGKGVLSQAAVLERYPIAVRAPRPAPGGPPPAPPSAAAGRFSCAGDPALSIRVDQDWMAFQPGEAVRGQVSWNLPPEHARHWPRLQLVWRATALGDEVREVVAEASFDPGAGSGAAPFAFTLPPEPYGLRGKHLTIAWSLELQVEGMALACRGELAVGPGGRDVVLPEAVKHRPAVGCLILLAGLAIIYALFQVSLD